MALVEENVSCSVEHDKHILRCFRRLYFVPFAVHVLTSATFIKLHIHDHFTLTVLMQNLYCY